MPVHYKNLNNPRDERLAIEHKMLDEFCENSPIVSYEAIQRRGGLPPEGYYFHYNLRSIIGINPDQSPIYDFYHTAKIQIPPEFPLGGQPDCYMTTPLWHPNIKTGGNFAGRICINADALGDWHTIDMLAERIGEMLQFKNYHAVADRPPYPEDAQAALWVRNYAEPRNIINKDRKIFTDDRPMLKPSPEWEARRVNSIRKATGIVIAARKQTSLFAVKATDDNKLILQLMNETNVPNGLLSGIASEYRVIKMEDIWASSVVDRVYIRDIVAYRINRFVFEEYNALAKIRNVPIMEIGGWIMGRKIEFEPNRYVLSFERFVQMHIPESQSKTQLGFGPQAWQELEKAKDIFKEEGLELVGWFHTHPGWGVFLSEDDINVHNTIFTKPYHIAMVLESEDDSHEVGFFSRKQVDGGLVLNNRANSYHRWQDFVNWFTGN